MTRGLRFTLLGLLLVEGFVLMGFEILSSRYMHPYFGSGIDTWACIISTVLLAMMCGYVIGGHIADRSATIMPLAATTALAAVYLLGIAMLGRPVLLDLMQRFEPGFPLLMGAAFLLLFLPVALLSAWSPFMVRVLITDARYGGRVAGLVYGVATLGNVIGALVTAFMLVPSIGVKAITLIFAGILVVLALTVSLLRVRAARIVARTTAAALGLVLLQPTDRSTWADESYPADYPEGIFFAPNGDLYFAEMALGRIRVISGGEDRVFWASDECGPTGVTEIAGNRLAVACHIRPSIQILDAKGNPLEKLVATSAGTPLFAPNDISADGNGGAFFSDSGVFDPDTRELRGRIMHLSADLEVTGIVDGLRYSNGVHFDPEDRLVYASDHLAHRIVRFTLGAFPEVADSEIWFDFSSAPKTAEWMQGLSGPDGLRVLDGGGLVVGLYGTGHVAVISACRHISLLGGFNRYVTSVGTSDGKLAVASAKDNSGPPFGGDVRLLDLPPIPECDAS